jgi:NADH dehydrogenase
MGKKIIITGAGGFIGSYLVEYFHTRGYEVLALTHNTPENCIDGVQYRNFFLGGYLYQKDFEAADYVVHCAYMPYSKKNFDANEINFQGTKDLYFLSWRYNVKKFIYISSLSAHEKAKSNYGRTKFKIEQIIDINKDVIIASGLVIGNGGLYGSINNFIKKHKFIPLINRGKQSIYTVDIDKLAVAIENTCLNNLHGKFIVANKEPISLKELFNKIALSHNKKIIYIFIPYFIAYIALWLIEILNINIGITREHLSGLDKSKIYKKDENIFLTD